MSDLNWWISETLAPLIAKAETAEQWAEICLREQQMLEGFDALP